MCDAIRSVWVASSLYGIAGARFLPLIIAGRA